MTIASRSIDNTFFVIPIAQCRSMTLTAKMKAGSLLLTFFDGTQIVLLLDHSHAFTAIVLCALQHALTVGSVPFIPKMQWCRTRSMKPWFVHEITLTRCDAEVRAGRYRRLRKPRRSCFRCGFIVATIRLDGETKTPVAHQWARSLQRAFTAVAHINDGHDPIARVANLEPSPDSLAAFSASSLSWCFRFDVVKVSLSLSVNSS